MSYTVKDLKADIANLPDDMVVYIQRDSEGNGYRHCSGVDPNGVVIDDSYHAEIFDADWTASEACLEDEEWEQYKSNPRVLIVFPS